MSAQFDLNTALTCGLAKGSEVQLNQKDIENLQLPCFYLLKKKIKKPHVSFSTQLPHTFLPLFNS